MEVYSHFAAGEGARALDLVRLQWGYMLQNPHSTESTFWEGYNTDGSFNFQGIYMSNSHGWAAGPGGALSHHVLGIRADLQNLASNVQNPATAFIIAPQPSGLKWCLGRLAFADDHAVDVQWNVSSHSRACTTVATDGWTQELEAFTLHLDLTGARRTANGRVTLPSVFNKAAHRDVAWRREQIAMDGQTVERSRDNVMQLPKPLHSHHTFVVCHYYDVVFKSKSSE